jgi:hypothetical protein
MPLWTCFTPQVPRCPKKPLIIEDKRAIRGKRVSGCSESFPQQNSASSSLIIWFRFLLVTMAKLQDVGCIVTASDSILTFLRSNFLTADGSMAIRVNILNEILNEKIKGIATGNCTIKSSEYTSLWSISSHRMSPQKSTQLMLMNQWGDSRGRCVVGKQYVIMDESPRQSQLNTKGLN